MSNIGLEKALNKIAQTGITDSYLDVFKYYYKKQEELLKNTKNNYIRECDIEPLTNVTNLEDIANLPIYSNRAKISNEVAIIKLNGGLGTTMGLNGPKSLLKVMNELTFLDIIIKTLAKQRTCLNAKLPLIFMNSFNTSKQTNDYINNKYPDFFNEQFTNEFIQHQEPKLSANNLEPVEFPANPHLEWCPPGHGDFYNSIYSSGVLEKMLISGYKYAFVSNSDNLGAIYNENIAAYFTSLDSTIMLELTPKTEKDIKGGHIVKRNGQNILREVAQIHEDDKTIAFDRKKHPFFNTNSIWFNLEKLFEQLKKNNGVLTLPLISNYKTVDPKDSSTEKCIQLEYAIGAGVNVFQNSSFICVPRSRFIGCKTNEDLLLLKQNDDLLKIVREITDAL